MRWGRWPKMVRGRRGRGRRAGRRGRDGELGISGHDGAAGVAGDFELGAWPGRQARGLMAGDGKPGVDREPGSRTVSRGSRMVSRQTELGLRFLMRVMWVGACCGEAYQLAANLIFLLLSIPLAAWADIGCTYRRYLPLSTPNLWMTELFLLLSAEFWIMPVRNGILGCPSGRGGTVRRRGCPGTARRQGCPGRWRRRGGDLGAGWPGTVGAGDGGPGTARGRAGPTLVADRCPGRVIPALAAVGCPGVSRGGLCR